MVVITGKAYPGKLWCGSQRMRGEGERAGRQNSRLARCQHHNGVEVGLSLDFVTVQGSFCLFLVHESIFRLFNQIFMPQGRITEWEVLI